jgi:Tfp pilus assembly protein PilO
MKGSDKAIVLGVVMAVVLVGFYMMVLAPKRNEASQLGKDIEGLKGQLSQQEQTAQFGEQARDQFPAYYSRLVVLGKAVPDNADTSSLLVELSGVAHHAGVQFNGITLNTTGGASSSSSSTAAPAAPPAGGSSTSGSTGSAPSTSGSSGSTSGATATPAAAGSSSTSSASSSTTSSSTSTPVSSTPAAPTETSAANLPLGAAVGPDSLAVMPYNLDFSGSYFQVADFLKGVDDLIHLRGSTTVAADGRLLTIDGFQLATSGGNPSSPTLKVSLAVTSFVTPASEGLTAGATPSGPSSVGTTPTQPASAPVSP